MLILRRQLPSATHAANAVPDVHDASKSLLTEGLSKISRNDLGALSAGRPGYRAYKLRMRILQINRWKTGAGTMPPAAQLQAEHDELSSEFVGADEWTGGRRAARC